jgi:hypothetical protein
MPELIAGLQFNGIRRKKKIRLLPLISSPTSFELPLFMSYAQLKSPGLALPDWKTTAGGDAAADGAGSLGRRSFDFFKTYY